MAELKNYVEGQPIEPSRPIVYTTIEEQAELKAYREFGDLSQLRALCDNYHELLNELRSRPTEAEIRAKAIDEFAEKIKFMAENKWIYDLCEDKDCKDFNNDIDKIAEQLKENSK